MHQHSTKTTPSNAASPSHFITAKLSGGPYHGQLVNVPDDEFYLRLTHNGNPVVYRRFNDAPVFRHEDAIVRLLGGGR